MLRLHFPQQKLRAINCSNGSQGKMTFDLSLASSEKTLSVSTGNSTGLSSF
jgi:hypothetical protein